MAKLRCYHCGELFAPEDAETKRVYVGEFWGTPAYDSVDVCPNCGSDDVEEIEQLSPACNENDYCDGCCECCEYAKLAEGRS